MIAEPELESTSCKAAAPVTDGFKRISELPLYAATQGRDSAHATPLLADAWADAIVCYWNACLAAGSIDPDKPLYLLDPSPGHGRFAWLLIRALRHRLEATDSRFKPCYIACSRDRAQLDTLATHPYFISDIQEGRLDTALWNENYTALHLHARSITLLHTDNPVVALCLQWFSSLPSDLFGVHDGKIFEGHAAVKMDESNAIAYAWREMDDIALSQCTARRLLQHCLTRFTSATLLMPVAACNALDAIAHLSCGRYLLLSADKGVCLEQQVRLGAFSLPATLHADNPALAVNYHALSLHQTNQSASAWNRQLQEGGIVLHAACRDNGEGIATHALPAMTAFLEKSHPDDIARLAAATAPADPATILTLLRMSHYDPQVLNAGMETILEHAPELSDTARKEWQSALSHVWANHLPSGLEDGFYYDAGVLAARLGHWGLAKECFRFGLACYGNDATELHHLACCESATGNTASSLTLLESALQLQPGHHDWQTLHASFTDRLQRWHDTGWYYPHIARDNELTLEPLGIEHAEAMFYQYRDEQIGVMTRLPELNTPDQVKNWIEENNRETGRANYAVMHACWGFIGVTSIHCMGDAGYFYFWIGTDFQDKGYGQRAARLLFDQMACNGIDNIFTSAYRENTRSRKALERIGFIETDIHAQPPDADLVFFYRPQSEAVRLDGLTMSKRLRELCAATDSPFVFVPSQQSLK